MLENDLAYITSLFSITNFFFFLSVLVLTLSLLLAQKKIKNLAFQSPSTGPIALFHACSNVDGREE